MDTNNFAKNVQETDRSRRGQGQTGGSLPVQRQRSGSPRCFGLTQDAEGHFNRIKNKIRNGAKMGMAFGGTKMPNKVNATGGCNLPSDLNSFDLNHS